jgi:mono/diheme cytochrome c family protein
LLPGLSTTLSDGNPVMNRPLCLARRRHLLAAAFLVFLAACGRESGREPAAATQLHRGEALYAQHCASCHGAALQGQPAWRQRRPDGRLPAPPHDDSGHTWHHPPEQLFAITKFGMVPPNAPPDYTSDMPAFAAVLKDDDIRDILAFIASRWSTEVRQRYRERFGR